MAWLSGCLLVPREAALVGATAQTPMGTAAAEYGVSIQMMTYRVNSTGVRKQAMHAGAGMATPPNASNLSVARVPPRRAPVCGYPTH